MVLESSAEGILYKLLYNEQMFYQTGTGQEILC